MDNPLAWAVVVSVGRNMISLCPLSHVGRTSVEGTDGTADRSRAMCTRIAMSRNTMPRRRGDDEEISKQIKGREVNDVEGGRVLH
jgi:hypothetical protein